MFNYLKTLFPNGKDKKSTGQEEESDLEGELGRNPTVYQNRRRNALAETVAGLDEAMKKENSAVQVAKETELATARANRLAIRKANAAVRETKAKTAVKNKK